MTKFPKVPKSERRHRHNLVLDLLIVFLFGLGAIVGFIVSQFNITKEKVEIEIIKENESSIEFSEEQIPAYFQDDRGNLIEDDTIPTVEEVDGGKFEDELDGVSLNEYDDLGAVEMVDTSSVQAFMKSVLNRCIIANNKFGAQCVSLARTFWWGYANRDVSTCGTGLAKGMMNCWQQNAGEDFKTIWNTDEIVEGTFIITGGTYTGHICMALASPINGYVPCLGENQGGKSCGEGIGGSATNIVNLSLKNFIGGYIPKKFIPVKVPDTSFVR